MAGLGITHAIDILAFAFIPSRQDTVELQNGLLAASALPNIDPALDTALARAPATVRIAFAQLVTGDGGLVVPLPVPSAFVGLAPRGSRLRRLGRAMPDCDEDSVSATQSSQSLLAEQFFVTVAAQVLDGVEPSHVPRFRALLDFLQERGTHHWLLAVPVPGLQQNLGMRHFRALLRYRLCMQMFPAVSGARAARHPWTPSVIMPFCALLTPARVASSSAKA